MASTFCGILFIFALRVGSSFDDTFVIPPGDPEADKNAIVEHYNKHARFTVLTAHTLRLEYSPTEDHFENRQTFVVWNRNLPVPDFKFWYYDDKLIIDTGKLRVEYSGGPFDDKTLSIKMSEPNLLNVDTWRPGLSTEGNLFGTFRAYDGLNGLQNLNCTEQETWETNNESAHCTFGLISRAGWAAFSDARTPVFEDGWIHSRYDGDCPDSATNSSVPCLGPNMHAKATSFNEEQCNNAGCCWIDKSCIQRQGNADLYFFGHGVGKDNYRQALYDFSLIAGKVPLPRRHILGVSWSRWGYGAWNGNQTLQMDVVRQMNSSGFPLDTFILDMNWHSVPEHQSWDGIHGWPINWTGYTWNTTSFPNSIDLLKFLHDAGLHVGANLHDAQGVQPHELRYLEMAKENYVKDGDAVLFHISDHTYADTLNRLVLGPLASGDVNGGSGFDFWWTDWQQGLEGDPGVGTTDIAELSPTAWLNHYRFMNYTGSLRRGQILSRFGGLGGHRYPAQFGGDIEQGWDSIEAVVYTNAIAANVLVAYWAQEIMQTEKSPKNDKSYELFTRMIEMGAWSPVFTMFGNAESPDNVWNDNDFPQRYRTAAREVLMHRSMLLPYRYTLAYLTHKTGLAMIRPMYYDYPFDNNSYSGKYNSLPQYLLGDLLVAPVTKEMDESGVASTTLWLPEDKTWFPLFVNSPLPETASGWVTVDASLDQVPVYAPGGSVLPMLPSSYAVKMGAASAAFDPLEWWVLPGGDPNGEAWCYEDDGLSNDYLQSMGVNLTISWNSAGRGCTDWDLEAIGDYRNAPDASSRQYFIRFVGVKFIAVSEDGGPVTQNGICNHSAQRDGMTPGTWCYGPKGSSYSADEYVLLALKTGKKHHSLSICSEISHFSGWPVWGYFVIACTFVVLGIGLCILRRRCASRRTAAIELRSADNISLHAPEGGESDLLSDERVEIEAN